MVLIDKGNEMKLPSQVKLTETRYHDVATNCRLYIGKIAANHWQCVVIQDGDESATGPICKTKMECFAEAGNVANSWGLFD